MRKLVSLALGLVLVIVAPTLAQAGPFAWTIVDKQIACVVEQQSAGGPGDPCPDPTVVNNPLDCTWDRDDIWIDSASGGLKEAVSVTICGVSDSTDFSGKKDMWALVYSKRADLTVALGDSTGRSWTATPVWNGSQYKYAICTLDNIPGPFTEIPGSNGGVGLAVTYTLTTSSPSRTNVTASFSDGDGIWPPACTA